MAAATAFGPRPEIVEAMPLSVLYKVATASERVRTGEVARITNGETVDVGEVALLVRQDRETVAEARKQARLSPEERTKAADAKRRATSRREAQAEAHRCEHDEMVAKQLRAANELIYLLQDHMERGTIQELFNLLGETQIPLIRRLLIEVGALR